MSRVKGEIELKVEEMKLQIKADLDTYIKGCVSLQKKTVAPQRPHVPVG